jgi:glycosyltransferase involved in cell wall biosynthesis
VEDQDQPYPQVLFVVPRFHTNLIGWLQGLTLLGVTFGVLVQTYGKSEDHSICVPKKMDPSVDYFKISISRVRRFNRLWLLSNLIRAKQPKLIVFRFEMNLTSAVLLLNILFSRTKFVIYQQWPLDEKRTSKRLIRFLITRILRVPIITPVISLKPTWVRDSIQTHRFAGLHFIPFGMPLREFVPTIDPSPSSSTPVTLLTIGKFQSRKNHLETIELLMANSNFRNSDAILEIIGEVSTPEHHHVHQEVTKYIEMNSLNKKIVISINKNHSEVLARIEKCDVFIMMSDREPASVSNLESMSFGKPLIIKMGNGTANYVEHGKGGFIITTPDEFHQSLNYFWEHPEFVSACHSSNRLFVKEFLDPKTTAQMLLAVGDFNITS